MIENYFFKVTQLKERRLRIQNHTLAPECIWFCSILCITFIRVYNIITGEINDNDNLWNLKLRSTTKINSKKIKSTTEIKTSFQKESEFLEMQTLFPYYFPQTLSSQSRANFIHMLRHIGETAILILSWRFHIIPLLKFGSKWKHCALYKTCLIPTL